MKGGEGVTDKQISHLTMYIRIDLMDPNQCYVTTTRVCVRLCMCETCVRACVHLCTKCVCTCTFGLFLLCVHTCICVCVCVCLRVYISYLNILSPWSVHEGAVDRKGGKDPLTDLQESIYLCCLWCHGRYHTKILIETTMKKQQLGTGERERMLRYMYIVKGL